MKNKKKITIIVLVILAIGLVISLISASTYALFSSEAYGSNPNNYSTGLLSIVAESKSDNISLASVLPMTDEDGIQSNPYVFTIKNMGNLDYKFNIKLLSTSSNTYSSNYIKLKIDNGEVTTLSSLTNSIIKKDVVLLAGESIDISIKVWLSIDTPNSELGKSFESKIVIDGQAIYTESNNTADTLANYISNLYEESVKTPVVNNNITYQYDTTHNLMSDIAGNIRYYGATPNNYIYFNCSDYTNQSDTTCEKWRIIGVFDGKVKIIRNDSIGDYSWDNKDTSTGAETDYGKNDWTTARLMKLLNPSDYYTIDENDNGLGQSLYYTAQSGTCYSGQNNATESCDFTSAGLKNDTTRNMIEEVTWNLGGMNSSSLYSDQMYSYERGTTVYSGRPTSWTGKVALAYPSDYGYAADFNSCALQLGSYNNSACTNVNWMKMMFGSNYMSLLTPYSSYAFGTWYVLSSGSMYGNLAYGADEVRPVLYLNSKLAINEGDGSSSSPYKLLID